MESNVKSIFFPFLSLFSQAGHTTVTWITHVQLLLTNINLELYMYIFHN